MLTLKLKIELIDEFRLMENKINDYMLNRIR